MGSIVSQVEVARTQEEVFAYVTDPAHFTEWQENVVDGHLDDSQPTVGAKCFTTRRIGGGERKVTSEITVFDPPRAWAVHGTDGPIRASVNVTVEPVGDGSRVTIDLDFEGHGIGKILVPLLVRPQSQKEMRRNMARLKTQLESTD